jgi:hypothetical protein
MTTQRQRGVNLSALALRHPSLTLYIIFAVAAAGIWAYMTSGQERGSAIYRQGYGGVG